ncbi:hypothetical protein PNK_2015 [Candidatus Protochlamydia naegleriophila]|uniref:Uncharacterized protein n=1 Tax=Candidatus Protochlamydia naegleriophila TaxID=389348 RepID=A0A0U5ETM0_9BACT|nr:hypothetical protein [Candidatus Protochlamydia naegleriophila]CUI17619.1 hypothetical protein PNK_2015 [Candidatus Protochlamydia naegleriophila]
MIIPINTVAPISYDELYVRNAIGLTNVALCPFLQNMDEGEYIQQQTRMQTPPQPKKSFKFAPLAGIVGAAVGGFFSGGLGFVALACGVGGLALTAKEVVELKAAKEKLLTRMARVSQKISLIQQERFKLHNHSDARQLKLAQEHFENVLRGYETKLLRKYRCDYDSDSDEALYSVNYRGCNFSFNFGERR